MRAHWLLGGLFAAAPLAAQSRVITVRATDYKFEAPATVPAGTITLTMKNDGREMHHLWLVQLQRGKTYEDFVKAMNEWTDPHMPSWAVDVGGPNTVSPGRSSSATLTLDAGRYVMVCYVPSPDGRPHVMRGMVKPLQVVASKAATANAGAMQAGEPKADVTITLTDYAFQLSTPITPGTHVIRVENMATQSHELVLGRLEPGKTMAQALAWLETGQKGAAPITTLGGASGLARGRYQFITATFEPGTYVLLCFIPDVNDAKPHTAHGMASEVRVLTASPQHSQIRKSS